MNRITLTAAALILAAATNATAGSPTDFVLTVLHHNDGESQLLGAGPNNDYGQIARFATRVAQLRADAELLPAAAPAGIDAGSVLITSGDNFLAGPEFNASLANGVPYFDSIALDLIGHDAFAIGNHEFDFGPEVLANLINSFSGPVTFLSANLDFSNEPALQPLVDNGKIAPATIVNVDGRSIGIIGLTTPNLPFISSPGGVTVSDDLINIVNAQVADLQSQSADIIILTTHLQGIGEEQALAAQLTGIDVIIAGGGGELLANNDDLLVPGDEAEVEGPYPVIAQDLNGEDLPIVTTSGDYTYLGRLVLGFDTSGQLTEVFDESGLVRVSGNPDDPDAVMPDPAVQAQVVDPVAAAVAELANNVIAFSEVELDGVRARIRSQETNLGNLAADSMLWSAFINASDFGAPIPQVGIQNGGGIRNDSVIPAGPITELDTFDILPFTNFVTVVEDVTPAQFKQIMENAVSRVDSESGTGRWAQIAGFRMDYDVTGTAQQIEDGVITTPGTRIQNITLLDGTVIVREGEVLDTADNINIAIADFLARGGDQYPFDNNTFTILGQTYQQALRDYVIAQLAGNISSIDYPEAGQQRINELATGDAIACAADLNNDASIDALDLAIVLANFGTTQPQADLDLNGTVDALDLSAVLSAFNTTCE